MFRTLFNDKEKMLELYNAVSEEQMGKEAIDDIETLTIETPLYIGSRNDLAFLIDGKSMFFCEQQINQIRKYGAQTVIIFRQNT